MTVRDGHMRDPAIRGASWNLEVQLYWIYVVLLALVPVAWAARWLVERRRGLINIAYPGGRAVRVPIGCGVLFPATARAPQAVRPLPGDSTLILPGFALA
jgi:adenylate cyclase